MKKQQEKIFSRVRRILCTFLILFMTIYPLHIAMDENNVQCETYILDNGWNAIAHGKTFENITLSETIFEMFGKEDTLVLKRTILEDEPLISNPILKVNSYYSIVDVYLDNELIYTYGREFYEKKKLVGYGTNFVELPEKYTGKELRIEYSVTENNAFEMIEPFTIADGNFIMQKEMAMASSDLAMVLFLIVFGMICMMVCLFIGRHHSYFITTLAIGMFSYLIGAWILCNNNLIIFVGTNLSIKTTIEYTTLYVLPITFMLYFYNRIKMGVLPKFVVLYYKILFGVQIIFAVGSYTLHILGIVFLPTWVLLVRVIIGLTAVFLVMLMVCDYRLTGKVNTIISTPFVLGILMIILELINHHISERITGAKSHQYSNTLLIAALLIVFSLFYDFSKQLRKSVYEHAEQKLLEKLAYADELTGLANRRKCEDVLEKLSKENEPYAVMSLDMNLLKQMNDTYGHEAGDMALKEFSRVLKETFSDDTCTVGRVGGDEFMIIVSDANEEKVKEYLHTMNDKMEEFNKHKDKISLSAATGYAFSYECDKNEDLHEVYRKADARMYECKRNMKERRR